ncbi:TrkH-domain-containing protein [Polychaeton citri CBS 116435]|uniref:TrkH-domain-containing protein n=1 Tax=Polychaeton citri CBS 116435 TaxID=1314669 RepID=A0A9P4UPH8_9PEZI|nr:TrkH-domain-containing protein [Polychaeton citri CBS 116435]
MRRPTIGPLRKPLRFVRRQLPPWNFITIHYTYFILTTLISAIVFWGSATPPRSVTFTDSLFMTVSAMTEAGLNTVNISTFNTWQQIMLFLLILVGSAVWVSAFVVHARRVAFERRFREVIDEQKRKREERRRVSEEKRGRSWSRNGPADTGTLDAYIDTVTGWVSRNSQFHGLSEEERLKLGGYEYRAIVYLSWLIPAYLILWQLLGCLGIGAYIAMNRPSVSRSNGLNPWWTGAFMTVSAFNNSGMMTLDANMTAFNTSYYTLITMSLLILAGNTCFPIFLRLIVWTLWKLAAKVADQRPKGSEWEERATTLRFLLDHPRRCYTHLFPAQHTWWLLASVVSLNGIDWVFFEILNIGNKMLTLPTNIRVIDGLFQAFAVRSGGFYVVAIPSFRIGLQVLYVIMMYISVYPVVITMRNSNVYEERSLGIYAEDLARNDVDTTSLFDELDGAVARRVRTLRHRFFRSNGSHSRSEGNGHFVRAQLRAQLAHDAWWIAIALFLIVIIETSQFERDPATFSVFNFLFETVSGYGCVGLSTGLPSESYSFSGSWHVLSKLVLCAVMIRGRHRGLPVAIDKAVLLPGEEIGRAEEEDGWRRLALGRTMTGMTSTGGVRLSRGRLWEQRNEDAIDSRVSAY